MQTRNRKVESQSQDCELKAGKLERVCPSFFERYAMKNMLKDRLIVAVLIASVAAFLSVCVSSWIGYNKDRYYISGTKSDYWWGYDKNTGNFWVCNANAKLNWAWIENPLLDERIHRVKRLSELEEDEKKQEVSRSGTEKNAQKNEKSAGLEYPAEFRAAVREDIIKRINNENGFAELLDSIQKELGDDDLLRQSAYEGYAKKPEFKKYLEKK